MPIIEECKVIKAGDGRAVIELTRRPECDGCKACAFNRRSSIRLTALMQAECRAGDSVIVEMPEKSVGGVWLVLFVIPLALLAVAAFITSSLSWYFQIAALCAALAVGLGLTVLCDRIVRKQPKFLPVIKQVVKEKENNKENNSDNDNKGAAND